MGNNLFNEKTIEELVKDIKPSIKQRKASEEWLNFLEFGKLKKEKLNYFKFGEIILKDLLGYNIRNMPFEEGNIEFSFGDDKGKPILGIEAKGTNTKDLFSEQKGYKDAHKTPINQLWTYMGNLGFEWGIATNYKYFVLIGRSQGLSSYYIFDFEDIKGNPEKLKEFIGIFSKESLIDTNKTKEIKEKSVISEREFTKEFYKLYHETRLMLIKEFRENENINPHGAVHFAQLFLNRLMFIFFAEDKGLFDNDKRFFENILLEVLGSYTLDKYNSYISDKIKSVFRQLDVEIPQKIKGFNGELFRETLPKNIYFKDFRDKSFFKDNKQNYKLKKGIDLNEKDKQVFDKYENKLNPIIKNILLMGSFDFNTEVNVNILGHIFEQSISDIEDLQTDKTSRRKKEGIFYTPEYITDYICRNTIVPYLSEKNANTTYDLIKEYANNIEDLEKKFKEMKILDPACGSGAFLIKATEIMLEVFKTIQEFKQQEGMYKAEDGLKRKHKHKGQITLSKRFEEDNIREIIKNNIFGVDINEESVEITKLALFLKMVRKNKKLTDLTDNIKQGNSLIDDEEVAGKLAFDWDKEFKEIMDKGGFDVVIGNPPYVRSRTFSDKELDYFDNEFNFINSGFDLSTLFIEKGLNLLKHGGIVGLISSNKFFSAKYGLKLRTHLIKNKLIEIVLNFGSGIFEDTPVETSIVILNDKYSKDILNYNNYPKVKNNLYLIADKTISTTFYSMLPNTIFFFPSNKADTIIIKRIKKFNHTISDFFKFTAGYGITGIKNMLKDNSFSNSIPIYTGKSIWRYYNKEPEYWIKENEIKDFDAVNVGLIRELSTKNRATIINNKKKIGLLNSVTVVESKHAKINISTFVAIFNSRLFNRLFCILYESTRTHSNLRFKAHYLNPIPISNLSSLQIVGFDGKVRGMIDKQNTLIKKKDKFLKLIKHEYKIEKVSKKLDKFHELEFDDFMKQLKVNLNMDKKAEILDFFEKNKKEILELKEAINKTNDEINEEVYKLYGITDKEKEIIENG